MNDEQERAKGKLLSRLLLIRSDLQGEYKKHLEEETRAMLEEVQSNVEMMIKSLIKEKK